MENDHRFIKEQLGRAPRGLLGVSARCNCGHPLVIKTKPILERREARGEIRREIFPTLYYLVCADIIAKVFQLESGGFLRKIQEKINTDRKLKDRFLVAQENYRRERNALAAEDEAELSESQKKSLQTGIGGVKNLDKIKCLHCHHAHYLATGFNIVGGEVAKLVGTSC